VLRDCGVNGSCIIGVATEMGRKTTRRHGADRDYAHNVVDGRLRCRASRNCNMINATRRP
jgi:hypothetical protein